MSEAVPTPDSPVPDWEGFYKSFRKPGYVAGYEILHKLGGGVFGVVYKARKESIGKPYAIKFLKVEDPAIRNQVVGELQTVSLFAQVDHPNLVSIEDKGVVDGIPYIVMGYAGDETLESRLEDGRLGEDEALRLFVQAARGVQALHEHSLCHFDLKPANIFLRGDVARVGDYGLSKLITETGMSLTNGRGTPYYMAPEMLRRKGDQRADVYSLGVILFKCLSGEVPFKGDSEWEVLKAHEEQPVVFPDQIAARWHGVLSRMLAKNPDERFQSVAEVLAAIRAPAGLVAPAPTARRAPGPLGASATRRAMRLGDAAVREARFAAAHARRRARRTPWLPWVLIGVAWLSISGNIRWNSIASLMILLVAVLVAIGRGRGRGVATVLTAVLVFGGVFWTAAGGQRRASSTAVSTSDVRLMSDKNLRRELRAVQPQLHSSSRRTRSRAARRSKELEREYERRTGRSWESGR